MSNAAIASCCQYGKNSGYGAGDSSGSGGNLSLSALIRNAPGARNGLLDTISRAIDNAIHGGNSGFVNSGSGGASGSGGSGNGDNVVPFPMVNPFKPVVQTRVPIPGLTARPKHVYEVAPDGSGTPDDEQFAGFGSLGFSWSDFQMIKPSDLSLDSGPSKLQTILGTVQATLPATIQALRANPNNLYPGASYNPVYQQGAGADIGATAGAAAGNVADSIGGIVARHPYLVLAAGAAAVLLFMNPPRRR